LAITLIYSIKNKIIPQNQKWKEKMSIIRPTCIELAKAPRKVTKSCILASIRTKDVLLVGPRVDSKYSIVILLKIVIIAVSSLDNQMKKR